MNYFKLFWIPVTAISGGILEFTMKDVYFIFIEKTRFFPKPLHSFSQILNKGFVAGLLCGIWYVYLDMPIVNYYLKNE